MTTAPREIIPEVQSAVVVVAGVAVVAVAVVVATGTRLIRIPDPIDHLFLALLILQNRRLAIRAIRPPGPGPAPIPIVTGRLVSRVWFNCGT
jgi:hypothetical protein